MPDGPLCVALMPPRSHTTKGPNEQWCRQQELYPAFAAVVCAFPSACQNSVSCCAERTTRKKATATIASLVLPRRLYWLTPFRMPCGRRNRSVVSPRLVVLAIFLARPELDPPQGILPLTSGVLIRTSWSCGMNS
ncbi:hypothetical protein TcG_10607 [Trypanosoma cruzi]|nr:hypothetical protein TcG_10607 [Trypanosoma cruzi]